MFSYFSSSSNVDNEDIENECNDENTNTLETADEDVNLTTTKNKTGSLSAVPADTIPAPSTSWSEAHNLYCSKHGTLKATIQQVLTETCKENQAIPWELPRRNNANVLIEANEVAEFLSSKRGNSSNLSSTATPTTPQKLASASSWLMSPLKVVSAVASLIRDPDDDVDEWIQDGDDALVDDDGDTGHSSSSLSNTILGLNIPIVNLAATEAAIQCLENEIGHIASDMPHVMGLSEWNAWAQSAVSKHHTDKNYQLSVHDNEFLLQVLVRLNQAHVIQRQNQSQKGLDVLVLSSTTMKIRDGNADDCIPEHLRIPVSLWDIERAEAQIEKNLEDWSEQAALCTKKALGYKKQNQIKLATIQLAKRRVIQQRIDSDSRLQIQLLQTKNAIESAQSNRSMVDIMANSAKLLKQLREETPLEEVDQTMDDLQSELDDLQDVTNALSSLGGNVDTMGKDEEDELLKELEGLSISDNTASTSQNTENETVEQQGNEIVGEQFTDCQHRVSEEMSELPDISQKSSEKLLAHA